MVLTILRLSAEWGISLKIKGKCSINELQNIKKNKKQNKLEHHSSLVARITSFYTNMFAIWMAVTLVVLILLVLSFQVYYIASDTNKFLNKIEHSTDIENFKEKVKTVKSNDFVLLNDEAQVIASTFSPDIGLPDTSIVSFDIINKRVYITHARDFSFTNGQNCKLVIYNDITMVLFQTAAIGAMAILLFLISILSIYVRGHYLTRKAFGVLDELILKANNISSQNLNLRLNVSDSTDELVEFALTFNKMMDRIEKAYEKQNQFVSDASHELRTPISVIQGYARMLDRWGKEDKEILQESILAIHKEAKSMQDLVEKLLFIARNDKNTLVLIKNSFDMSALMHELCRDTTMLETQHEIKCSVVPGVSVFGDRDRIKQALRIFVDNAIKYTDKTGTITIELEKDGDNAVAIIKDTGRGIPEKDLPNVFDRFYRVDTSRERDKDKGGHGLGLSIARIIVLRHGGRIKVASKLGVGTRFSIYLPLEHVYKPEV